MTTQTVITFTRDGDFEALHAAQDWCRENGISYGSLCRDDPVGLLYGDWAIAKWRNLSPAERKQLDGRMEGDFRHGPVTIRINPKRMSLAPQEKAA
jgi:hypothetical protein